MAPKRKYLGIVSLFWVDPRLLDTEWSYRALAIGDFAIAGERPFCPGFLKLDVKGIASYITTSNDSALLFPRIDGVDGATKKGVLAAHLSNTVPA